MEACADCINSFIKEICNGHFKQRATEEGKTKEEIANIDYEIFSLYIWYKDKGNEWKALNSAQQDFSELSAIVNVESEENWEKNLRSVGYEICAKRKEVVKDFRLESDGENKELLWLLLAEIEEKNYDLQILAEVILDEIVPKYYNMMFFDEMDSLRECEEKENNGIWQHFFYNLSDMDWLCSKYVEKVRSRYNNLPKFQLLCHLSSMTYEKRQIKTKLYFSENEMSETAMPKTGNSVISFYSQNILFKDANDLRTVRKIMEMAGTQGGVWIKLPEMNVEGVVQDKEEGCPNLYIEFIGNAEWELKDAKKKVLLYKKGEYYIPIFEEDEDGAIRGLERFLIEEEKIKSEKVEKIKETIINLKKNSPHGTAIVFMENVPLLREIEVRLGKFRKAFQVREFDLSSNRIKSEVIQGITAIDGAILADLDCKCQAVGAILDGETVIGGNSGRGARYNSIANYVNWYKQQHKDVICFAVIFSEDGMVDAIIPK